MNVPKNLEECLKRNDSANELLDWAIRIEAYGLFCMICILVGGLVISLINSCGSLDDEIHFGLFVAHFIVWIVIACIEIIFSKFCASLLHGLSCIVDNTTVSARVAVYEAQLKETSSDLRPTTTNKQVNSNSGITRPRF